MKKKKDLEEIQLMKASIDSLRLRKQEVGIQL
jgi:hypothetical protein